MASSSIPNSNPVTGRTSTQSSKRLKRSSNRTLRSVSFCSERWALNVERLPRRSVAKAGWTFSFLSAICNLQSAIGRVKGAWWPSRSSKPLSIPHTQGRGRFDSYPLRGSIFDFRLPIFDWPQMRAADRIKHPAFARLRLGRQTLNIKHRERG